MKNNTPFLASLFLCLASSLAAAIPVGQSPTVMNFDTQPSVTDGWSALSLDGGSGDAATADALTTAVQAVDPTSVNQAIGTAATTSWVSPGFLQTKPTGNKAALLMATLQNNLGVDSSKVIISYTFQNDGVAAAEEIPGYLAYYRLPGATAWVPIPEFTTATAGNLTATLNIPWPAGGLLYILWADDNSSIAPDTGLQIDNFTVSAVGAIPTSITASPTNLTVMELMPARFAVTAAGNPVPTYQWYKSGQLIAGATNSSYTLPEALLLDHQAEFVVVAANTISNVTYAATSSVARLTVLADTTAPVLVDVFALGSNQVQVVFSEKLELSTVTNVSAYALTNASGSLAIANATLDISQSNVVLTVATMTPNGAYTLVVNGLTDRSTAKNVLPAGSTRTFVAYSYLSTAVGTPAVAGQVNNVSGGFDVLGGGTNIGGASDQMFFYYQQRSGDFDVAVRVLSVSLSDAFAKAGIMARDTLATNAAFAAILATPSVGGVFSQIRTAAGAAATTGISYPVNYPYTWLRLKRAGNVFNTYASIDGRSWTDLGSATLTLTQSSLYLGYAACGGSTSEGTVARFRDLTDSPGGTVVSTPPPREPLGPSTRRGGLTFTEIMFNPRKLPGTNNSLEFVEIFNAQSYFEDISGWELTGSINYTFPSNTILKAGQFIVVAKNPDSVASYYQLSGVFGPFDGSLPNDAGLVRLRNRAGGVVLEVNYNTRPPWPTAADGTGHSLVLARPSYGEGDPRAWEASAWLDGSPGAMDPIVADPLNGVVINEFLANSEAPQEDYVELYNRGNTAVDLSGAWLSDKRAVMTDGSITNKFRIPDNTVLQPRQWKVYYEHELGFGMNSSGETILLVNSNQTRIIDIVPLEGQLAGISSGRYPDGAEGFQYLKQQTPGMTNAGIYMHAVVINELMYDPISGNSDDEYVELYNKGTNAVDLGRWRFTAGIDYTFPVGTILPTNGYLVVAKNITNLLANYPNLTTANTMGDYQGTLANGGERIALSCPEYVVTTNQHGVVATNVGAYILIDEVTYLSGGRWGNWAGGGGSSLELKDPRSDNRLPSNWADSDESQKGSWTNMVWTEYIDHVFPRPEADAAGGALLNEIQIMNLGRGEALIDDVDVRVSGGAANLVLNGTFDAGIASWLIQGNHVKTSAEPVGPGNPSPCLHLRSSAGGDNGANRVECALSSALTAGQTGVIAAKLRWLCGQPDILLRTHGGGLETVVHLPVPRNLGTPGLPNSRKVINAGPAITQVSHFPALPAANTSALVTARISDPDGISYAQLRYRIDPSTTVVVSNLVDNGTGGDAVAGDGIYSAIIPAQAAGTLVAFTIVACDSALNYATNLFPSTSECLVRFGEPSVVGSLGIYRLWMTKANMDTWINREKLSNEALDGTMVYGSRIIYNASARYRGSPFTRSYSSPIGVNVGATYVWNTPDDEPFLNSTEVNLDALEPLGTSNVRDATALREMTSFTMAEQLGLSFSYQRFVHVVINGVTSTSRNIPIYSDTQQPNSDYVNMWFDGEDRGDLFKIDDWFEYNNTPGMQGNKCASLENFTTVGGAKKKARYRWSWEKKANHGINDDYTSLFEAVDAFNAYTTDPANYVSKVEDIVNIEEWLTVLAFRHVIGDWDGYGYQRGKNQFTYHPDGKKFWMLLWDLDFSIGCNSGNGPTSSLFNVSLDGATGQNNMPEANNLINVHPYFRRIYFRALDRVAKGPLMDEAYMPKLEARYQALLKNGVTGTTSPYVTSGQGFTVPDWIRQRRTNINTTIATYVNAAFTVNNPAVTTNVSSSLVTLSGTAPVSVRYIRVNGERHPITWNASTYTGWTISFYAPSSNNVLKIQAYDVDDQPIASMASTNTFIYAGYLPPAQGTVYFTEIMYRPETPNTEYVELFNASTNYTFNLSGWRVNGLDFTFPLTATLPPRKTILLVKDKAAVTAAYSAAASAAGVYMYNGTLSTNGETLSLFMPGAEAGTEELVDRVHYEADTPWAAKANGQGASLQLIDPNQDHGRLINWTDGFAWRQIVLTNFLKVNPASSTNFEIRSMSAGDFYIDDVRLEAGGYIGAGTNFLANGGFELPLEGNWLIGSTCLASSVSTEIRHSGNASLHVVASTRAASVPNDIWQRITALPSSNLYTLSFWVLPSSNMAQMTVQASLSMYTNVTIAYTNLRSSPAAINTVSATLPPMPRLYLNEVQAENTTGLMDNQGEREPWVEIYNADTNAVSLDGWYLTTRYDQLDQWAFPPGTVLQPGEFRVIWADGQSAQTADTNLHTSFRLSPGTGTVALVMTYYQELKVYDYLNYAALAPNTSHGAYPDGQLFYRQQFGVPTGGGPNNPAPPKPLITINEWMAWNTNTIQEPIGLGYEDWFELYNAGSDPVNLAGFYLTDDPVNQPRLNPIPPGYVVPAHGRLLVWADGQETRNATNSEALHVKFQLSRSGEAIALFTPDMRPVDAITFTNQAANVSQGRFPDGALRIVTLSSPTPNAPNVYTNALENLAPSLDAIPNKVITIGQRLEFAVTATDPDVPAQQLSFSLEPGAAPGALVSANGIFAWTPTTPSLTNTFTIRVTDDGIPPASTTGTFSVLVAPLPSFSGVSAVIAGNQVSFGFQSTPGVIYQVQYKNSLSDTNWTDMGAPRTADGTTITFADDLRSHPTRYYRAIVK